MKAMYKMSHFLKSFILLISLIVLGCSSDDKSEDLGGGSGYIGPVKAERFNQLPAPSQTDAQAVLCSLVSKNQSLLEGPADTLALRLFEAAELKYKESPDKYNKSGVRLSIDEWKLYITSVKDIAKLCGVGAAAGTETESSFEIDLNKPLQASKGAAFYYAYWAILILENSSEALAQRIIDAHMALYNDAKIKNIIMHNYLFGIKLKQKFPKASSKELKELLKEDRYMYLDSQTVPEATDCLVYSEGKDVWDVEMTGTLTNPDSNKTWDLTLYLYQSGSTIRGSYLVVHGKDFMKRRFHGTVSGNGINLTISYPYSFESNSAPCREMMATLTGNTNALEGPWTSSTCRQGGVIKAAKKK